MARKIEDGSLKMAEELAVLAAKLVAGTASDDEKARVKELAALIAD